MRILALAPYFGGSHQAFLEGWAELSRHAWTRLTLPATKWKWRMRHGAITLAAETHERHRRGESWDLVFCSDMLSAAEYVGLAPEAVGRLPRVAYFHENQLTYPVRQESERDYHFAFSNLTTALAAHRVWFNSAFHRDAFLGALAAFLRRMPDHQSLDVVDAIRAKADVRPPGIAAPLARGPRRSGAMRIAWVARWEYDKLPEVFFDAMYRLAERNVAFRLSVVGGGNAREVPAVFEEARQRLAGRIADWGYLEQRRDYERVLAEADVVVSTARHEFFGIGIVEAVAAGAYPLVPRRLAYPEVLGSGECSGKDSFFYDGEGPELADRLAALALRVRRGELWEGDPLRGIRTVERFFWPNVVPAWDDELEQIVARRA